MFKIAKLISVSMLVIGLSACSNFPLLNNSNVQNSSRLCATDDGVFYDCQDISVQNKVVESHSSVFSTDIYFTGLSEYTEQMAVDIQHDLKGKVIDELIVVASFVPLSGSLQSSDSLGNQLAEYFINDLQQIGLPVSDHKLTGTLNVNSKGDFVFSRDMNQIHSPMNIGYVLSGTMHRNNRGVMINARLMNFNTKGVLASTSKFIPNLLLEGIL